MLHIDFPQHSYRIKKEIDKHVIFDEIRKKWITLTPEEWVRQNFIQYLVQKKQYPPSVIAIEKEIRLGELKKRCDIVVYRHHQPWMIVECKEQATAMNDEVVQQILRYNITLQVKILVITNGASTYAIEVKNQDVKLITELPEWFEISE